MPTHVRCPSCRTTVPWNGNPFRPFCSERCRTLDLGAWLTEHYRIPVEEPEAGEPDDVTAAGDDSDGDGDDRRGR